MKLFTAPPPGYVPTCDLKIFSLIKDATHAAMAQRHTAPDQPDAWVLIPTERVEKIQVQIPTPSITS